MDDFTEVENQVSDSDGPRKKRKSRLHARFEPETFTAIASDVAEGTEMESADTVQETTKETRTKKKKKSKKSEEFDDAAIAHLAAEGLLDDHASISAENQVTNDIHEKPRKKKKSRKDQEESTAENEQDGLVEPTDGQQETGRKPKGILKGRSSEIQDTDAFEVSKDGTVPTRKIKKPKKTKEDKEKRTKEEKDRMKQEWTNSTAAIEYLRNWKNAREEWSFQKVRQIWVLRNWKDADKMSDDDFEILLEYVVALKGGSRVKTLEEAKKVVENYESTETYGEQDELRRRVNDRATQMVNVLSS